MNRSATRGLPVGGVGTVLFVDSHADRQERAPLIICGLFALVPINFLLIGQPRLSLREEISICVPKAVCAHVAGAGITELAQVWASAWQMGPGIACLPGEAYKATDVSKFS